MRKASAVRTSLPKETSPLLCGGTPYIPDSDASSGTGAFHSREIHPKLLRLALGSLRSCHTSRALLLFTLGALSGLIVDLFGGLSCPLGRPASLALQGPLEGRADILQPPL